LIPDGKVFLCGGGVVDALGEGALSLLSDSLERRASNRRIIVVACRARRMRARRVGASLRCLREKRKLAFDVKKR
jgi:hypothetical protein